MGLGGRLRVRGAASARPTPTQGLATAKVLGCPARGSQYLAFCLFAYFKDKCGPMHDGGAGRWSTLLTDQQL